MLRSLALAAMLVMTVGTAAQAADLKVGYVDMEKAFNDYFRTQEENTKLQDLQQAKKTEADNMIAEINKMKEESELLTAGAKEEKEAAIRERIRALREYERETVEEIRDRLLSLRQEILTHITGVIKEKGQREGYTFIFVEDALIFKQPGLDLTGDLVATLNKEQKR